MTSVQWVYDSPDDAVRAERKAAMKYADAMVRGYKFEKYKQSPVECEAIDIRRAELTWSDVRQDLPSNVVGLKMSTIFWAVLFAQLVAGFIVAVGVAILRLR